MSRYGEKKNLEVTILSGDRDTFQLATDKVTIRIPHTKGGKTETDLYNKEKIIEKYGIEPQQLIDVKGLQGDTSDNIPGVPGVGEKTALSLIQRYGSIENLYKKIENGEDDLKGKQREKIVNNKELAFMSKTLGTINLQVPISDTLEDFKVEEWNKEKVLEIFKKLNFKRYIDRFNLLENNKGTENQEKELFKSVNKKEEEIIQLIKEEQEIIFYFETKENDLEENIIKEEIVGINIYNQKQNEVYNLNLNNNKILNFKEILEDEKIKKISIDLTKIYILLKQVGINIEGMHYDIAIASYILNPTNNKLNIDNLIEQYLNIDINEYTKSEDSGKQINLFDNMEKEDINQEEKEKYMMYAYSIGKIKNITSEKLKEVNSLDLFYNIDMPTVEVLSDMQWNGMYVDKEELEQFGKELTSKLETITKIIYEMAGEEFNINSTKQLGEILFEKMKLPVIKKTKSGYSTDVDVLEKLKKEDPIIEQILEYRQLMKLNSTYVEGLKPYINIKTNRIHSFFHQTITATGRISSTEPNLQNISIRDELGKEIRKAFVAQEGYHLLSADYSQIELRMLAHMANEDHMIKAFNEGLDIHTKTATLIFNCSPEEVDEHKRRIAKTVNFGIVYGQTEFGLSSQLNITRKEAGEFMKMYFESYPKIHEYMNQLIDFCKENGYVETLFHRRREIPEINDKNFMTREFGKRAAMNAPIQGSAADLIKIAMLKMDQALKDANVKSKMLLQIHDELIFLVPDEELDLMQKLVKETMESAMELKVPLKASISVGKSWYEAK